MKRIFFPEDKKNIVIDIDCKKCQFPNKSIFGIEKKQKYSIELKNEKIINICQCNVDKIIKLRNSS